MYNKKRLNEIVNSPFNASGAAVIEMEETRKDVEEIQEKSIRNLRSMLL